MILSDEERVSDGNLCRRRIEVGRAAGVRSALSVIPQATRPWTSEVKVKVRVIRICNKGTATWIRTVGGESGLFL